MTGRNARTIGSRAAGVGSVATHVSRSPQEKRPAAPRCCAGNRIWPGRWSDPVVSRLVRSLAADQPQALEAIRAAAQLRAWALAADAGLGGDSLITIDLDAAIVIAHSPALAAHSLTGV